MKLHPKITAIYFSFKTQIIKQQKVSHIKLRSVKCETIKGLFSVLVVHLCHTGIISLSASACKHQKVPPKNQKSSARSASIMLRNNFCVFVIWFWHCGVADYGKGSETFLEKPKTSPNSVHIDMKKCE